MQGHVTILGVTPNIEAMIASGGRISTMDGTADEIFEMSLAAGREKNEKLIGKVLSSGHTSVLEHGFVNLAFENVSVLAEQFLIEFRLASFTVKSRRYVDFSKAGYVSPELEHDAQREIFDETVRTLFAIYDELEAAGVPKEDARFVLPYCFCSNFFCSMNARELLHVMNELRYGRGSEIPELWALGESLFLQCEEKLPFLAVRKKDAYAKKTLPLPDGVPVLPEAQVTLLDGTREPEKLICRAAYLANGMQAPGLTRDEQARILRTLLQNNRKRELEQASFTLLYSGMSLAALTHLTRHRMQALCAPDLLENADYSRFVLPESVRKAGMESRYREAFSIAEAAARKLSSLGAGKDALSYLLVSGLQVPVVSTMNAGELYTFFRLRTCERAQWEIRELATEALKVLRAAHPGLFSLYGPTCFMTGACPEGRMCCGKTARVREKFSGTL